VEHGGAVSFAPVGHGRSFTRAVPVAATVAVLALVAWLLYGPGFVTNDPIWSLAWADELLHGITPSFADPAASTPHPLPNLVAVVLAAVFGTGAEPALHVLGYVAFGFAGHAVFLVAQRLFGTAAAVVAVVLTLTRPAFASFGTLAVGDIAFCALVLYAVAAELRRPLSRTPVLVLLVVAGLIRPEAWFLSAAYAAWIWHCEGREAALRALPLAATGPVTWVVADWVVTGHPLFSLTATRDAAARYGRVTGLDGLVREGIHVLGYELRPTVLVAAALGFLVTWRDGAGRRLFIFTAAAAVAIAIPVAFGTPLNGRYLAIVLALCCVAAAGAVTLPLRRPGVPALAVAGVAVVVVLAGAPDLVHRVRDTRADLTEIARSHDAARQLVRHGVPCEPVTVTGLLGRPAVAVWADVPLDRVTVPSAGVPDRGTFLIGTRRAAGSFTTVDGGGSSVRAPAGARTVARDDGWTLSAACG
jgi:hypothetical protein